MKIFSQGRNMDALDMGIDFEYKTMKFCEDYLSGARDLLEKQFMERMVEKGRGHYTALKDMKHYMSDPAAWYQEMERGSLGGA